MSEEFKLSPSEEEYLEAIYTKQVEREEVVSTRDIAACLGVKDASVTGMLKKLSLKGLVDYRPYRGVILTKNGLDVAEQVKRKHRLLECFLVDVCGINKAESHKQACEIEHVISDKAIDSISAQLGHPSACPDGSTIPKGEDIVEEGGLLNLSEVSKGTYWIKFLASRDPQTINRLCSLGLLPGLSVTIVKKIANGPLIIEIKDTQIALSRDIAESIKVSSEHVTGLAQKTHARRRFRRGEQTTS